MPSTNRRKKPIIKIARKQLPEGWWTKCAACDETIYCRSLADNLQVCPSCDFHMPLSARERLGVLLDPGSFVEWFADLSPVDPLEFEGPRRYRDRLAEVQAACQMADACIAGGGAIEGEGVAIAVTDSRFLMGSMGSVVGEVIARTVDEARVRCLPLVIVSGSGGGARMQEGLFSLMQMAKTSAALMRLHRSGGFFVSVLTDPTMAGVMASFASLGDIIIAEPKALIGFTGPRVIESTLRQQLPDGFQRSDFLLEHGQIDCVVHRKHLRSTIGALLRYAPHTTTRGMHGHRATA